MNDPLPRSASGLTIPPKGRRGERLVTLIAREADPNTDVVLLANRVTEPDAYGASVLRPVASTDVRYLTLSMRSDWRGGRLRTRPAA